jgi:hypothetical protein
MPRFVLVLAFALAAALAAGCKSKQPDTTPPTTGSAAPAGDPKLAPDPNVKLELAEMKIIDVGKNLAIAIHADGTIEYEGQIGAKVTPNGQIVNDKGDVGFTLMSDGAIKGPDGTIVDLNLSADGVIKSGDRTISVKDDGTLDGANPEAPQMRIEGATTPALKRTAMFVLIVLTTPEETQPPPATKK